MTQPSYRNASIAEIAGPSYAFRVDTPLAALALRFAPGLQTESQVVRPIRRSAVLDTEEKNDGHPAV